MQLNDAVRIFSTGAAPARLWPKNKALAAGLYLRRRILVKTLKTAPSCSAALAFFGSRPLHPCIHMPDTPT
jgi:hypothetical protein